MAGPDANPDPRQQMAQLELVQRELQRTERHLEALEQALVEAQQALGTVRHLAESQGTQEVLLPIGGGVHVRARVDPAAPVLMPIGAGYSTEGESAKVAQALEERVQSIARSYEQASQRAEELAGVAASLNDQLSQFSEPAP
jgi:prefoldin alpha subunit